MTTIEYASSPALWEYVMSLPWQQRKELWLKGNRGLEKAYYDAKAAEWRKAGKKNYGVKYR